jgi:hypothetical protein
MLKTYVGYTLAIGNVKQACTLTRAELDVGLSVGGLKEAGLIRFGLEALSQASKTAVFLIKSLSTDATKCDFPI